MEHQPLEVIVNGKGKPFFFAYNAKKITIDMAEITTNVGALIPINESNGNKAVSARDLHAFLESKQEFANWIKNRIEKYDLVENVDYVVFDKSVKNPNGGRPQVEYALTIDAAKELSMVEGNEKGKEARRYFIACEKKLNAPLSPSELILKLAQVNVDNERRIKGLEEKQQKLESTIEDIKQRTTTELKRSTIVAYVSRNNIKLDVQRYGAMGRKASSLCKKKGVEITKIPDVRWGNVSVFPDEILDEVFNRKN